MFVPSLSKLEVEPLRDQPRGGQQAADAVYTESTLKHLAKKVEDTGHGSCCFFGWDPGWKTLFGTKKTRQLREKETDVLRLLDDVSFSSPKRSEMAGHCVVHFAQ